MGNTGKGLDEEEVVGTAVRALRRPGRRRSRTRTMGEVSTCTAWQLRLLGAVEVRGLGQVVADVRHSRGGALGTCRWR